MANILNGLAEEFTSSAQVAKVKSFLLTQPNFSDASKVSMEKALANAEYNIQWAAKNVPQVIGFYKTRNGAATTIPISLILLVFALFFTTFIH